MPSVLPTMTAAEADAEDADEAAGRRTRRGLIQHQAGVTTA